jgi:hypothetical protein
MLQGVQTRPVRETVSTEAHEADHGIQLVRTRTKSEPSNEGYILP